MSGSTSRSRSSRSLSIQEIFTSQPAAHAACLIDSATERYASVSSMYFPTSPMFRGMRALRIHAPHPNLTDRQALVERNPRARIPLNTGPVAAVLPHPHHQLLVPAPPTYAYTVAHS